MTAYVWVSTGPRLRRVVLGTTLVLATASLASAQHPIHKQGLAGGQAMESALPFEQVDPLSGNLVVSATDLTLPGNAGFDLQVQRFYNSAIYPDYATASVDIPEVSWAGLGWRLHFGRVLNPYSTASGETQIELGDGSVHPLYTTAAFPEGWITRGLARYDRSTLTLRLPNGVRYTFGREVHINTEVGDVRYVTEIRDAFDNLITVHYFDANGPPDGVQMVRQHLSPTQIREVTFGYHPGSKKLTSMAYAGQVWEYEHDPGPGSHTLLRRVRPPGTRLWEYEYSTAAPGHELNVIRAPLGGTVSYTYGDATHRTAAVTTITRAVLSRTVGGRDVMAGTWTFAYDMGTNHDETHVTSPCGVTKYRFLGHGLSGDFSQATAGSLAERRLESGGVLLQQENFTYVLSEQVSPDFLPGNEGLISSNGVYNALLRKRETTRGSPTPKWTTTLLYRTGHGTFNDYGQPYQIEEEGENIYQSRVTTRTFQTGFSVHLAPRVASEAVSQRMTFSQLSTPVQSSWTYNGVGFLTASTVLGIAHTLVPRADGNVHSVTDALGHTTTFGYSWGRVSSMTTPHDTNSIVTQIDINPDGTVAWAGVGGIGTAYTYHPGFLLASETPTGTATIFYGYDNVSGEFVDVWRAGMPQGTYARVRPDGFGRTIRTTSPTGVKTDTAYDACGRPTFVSAPYTSGPGTRGTSTTYDGLSRAATVTAPGGAVTTYTYSGLSVAVTNAESQTTQYDYMGFGTPSLERLVSVTEPNQAVTRYEYEMDSLRRVEVPGVPARVWNWANGRLMSDSQPESGTTTYIYDAAGQLQTVTTAASTTTLDYFKDGRLKSRDAPGTADDATLAYDALGRLLTQSGGGVVTTFAYDAAGRVSQKTDTVGGHTFQSQYVYDTLDNLTRIVYPHGRQINYEYQNQLRLSAVKNGTAAFATSFQYGDGGHLASYITGQVTHAVTLDARDRVHQITAGAALDLTYSYDHVNRVKVITDPRPGMSQTFDYDLMGRMYSADGPWGALRWTHDQAGNRLTEILGSVTTYHYDASTQRLTSTSGAAAETFSYDALGRLTGDSRGTYTYNARSLLATASGPGSSASYTYDPAGSRITRTVNGITTYTIRGVGGEVLSEFRSLCAGGAPVWQRDVVYGGGRLLGAVRAPAADPTVRFAVAATSVDEAQTGVTLQVQITTPGGGVTPCTVAVPWHTQAGTAVPGQDYTTASGAVVFPAGTASGAQQAIAIALLPDTANEQDETFTVHLGTPAGAALQTPAVHTVTILDDDPAPVMAIETPAASASVKTPFTVSGWAIDGTMPTGTGVDLVQVSAQPTGGSEAVLGTATYGLSKPAVGQLYGARFTPSGYTFTAHLAPGTYQVIVRARNAQTLVFTQQQVVSVTVQPSNPQMAIDAPAVGTYAQPVVLSGWAIDLGTSTGTGVDQVTVSALPASGPAIPLGTATYGITRSDIGQLHGTQFTNSGYQFLVRGLAPGTYTLQVTARSTVSGTEQIATREVTLTANPVMAVETPGSGATLNQSFPVSGWAIDFAAATGTGVDAVHLWAYPSGGGTPVFWGAATLGGYRGDVAAAYGSQFGHAGFTHPVSGATPGSYTLIVYARSTLTETFNQAVSVPVTVAASSPITAIDTPGQSASVGQPFTVAGWAVDQGAPSGTGVDLIHVYAVPNGGAGTPQYVGTASYGGGRPDVAAYLGHSQFTNCGYGLSVSGLAAGSYRIDVYARSTVSGQWHANSVYVTVQ